MNTTNTIYSYSLRETAKDGVTRSKECTTWNNEIEAGYVYDLPRSRVFYRVTKIDEEGVVHSIYSHTEKKRRVVTVSWV